MSRIAAVGERGRGSEKFSAGEETLDCTVDSLSMQILFSLFSFSGFSLLLITSKQMELTLSPTKKAVLNFCHLKQYRCILYGSVFISNCHLTPFKCSVPMLTRIIFKMVAGFKSC